jgi:GNAT superfamily N-acetyltransferase
MCLGSANPLIIQRTSPEGVSDALGLVLGRLEREKAEGYVDGLSRGIRSGEISTDGLWEARRRGELVGAIFSQVQQGKTAVVWPPRLVPGEPPETAHRLLADSAAWLAQQGVRIAHALLERVDRFEDTVLRGGGFAPLATLLYLVSLEGELPASPPGGPLEFEMYHPGNHHRLAGVVQATYEHSLDCPSLDGVRDVEDVLAGYRGTGSFCPSRWLIVRQADRDCGCLILADHPEEENWELLYFGLVRSARGHGWGKQIVQYAQWLTRRAGRCRLVAAVDAANRPALDIYTAAEFRAWDRRHVYARVFAATVENSL